MTPDRARKLSRRWMWSGIAAAIVGGLLRMAGFDLAMPLLLACWLCVAVGVEHQGWARGFEAAQKVQAEERS